MTHADTVPASTIWLSTFYMDIDEVTVERYRACVAAGHCKPHGPVYPDFSSPQQPITGVTWFDAVDYCASRGGHLPTEAEWEKAARGPDGPAEPWGSEPADCARAVIQSDAGRSCGVPNASPKLRDKGRVLAVGAVAESLQGARDSAYEAVGRISWRGEQHRTDIGHRALR